MKKTSKTLLTIWRIVKNKYVATLIIFVLLMCFSENNIFLTARLRSELNDLKRQQRQLNDEMRHDSTHLQVLRGDINAIERYGREVYYLRRENEDVYVFDKH